MRKVFFLYAIGLTLPAAAQFAPQAGVAGSGAISKSDNRFVDWASNCVVERGWVDIADKSQGKASIGAEAQGIGKADNYVVSLGDSGVATLTFDGLIYNGLGADFAVFENGFNNPANAEEAFLELAFVEVSSDGVNFTRFAASSQTESPQVPGAGVYMNARKVNNLAGKYIVNYGTPFDLEELKGTPGLDVDKISHVRIVDVIGSIGAVGTKDKDGNPINDPYPTPYPSSGFDLDAVGVIHSPGKWPSGIAHVNEKNGFQIFPNPVTTELNIKTALTEQGIVVIKDVTGRLVAETAMNNGSVKINVQSLAPGVYHVTLRDGNDKAWSGRFTKY